MPRSASRNIRDFPALSATPPRAKRSATGVPRRRPKFLTHVTSGEKYYKENSGYRDDPAIMRVLCDLYEVDFVCFPRYEPPKECFEYFGPDYAKARLDVRLS